MRNLGEKYHHYKWNLQLSEESWSWKAYKNNIINGRDCGEDM